MLLLLLLALFYSSLFSPSSSFLCLASPTQAPAIDLLVIIPTRALDVGLAQILCSTSCALSSALTLLFYMEGSLQELLEKAWLGGRKGYLSPLSEAKAWALREAWRDAGKAEYGMCVYIAGKLWKTGEKGKKKEHPGAPAIHKMFKRMDADPDWFPGKSCQQSFGPPSVITPTNQSIVARSAMAMSSRGKEPTYPALVANNPQALLNPVTGEIVGKKRLYAILKERCFDDPDNAEDTWENRNRLSKDALTLGAKRLRLDWAHFEQDRNRRPMWYFNNLVWTDICNTILPGSEKQADAQAMARKGSKTWSSKATRRHSTKLRGKKEALKQKGWKGVRVYWAPILTRGKLHIELLGDNFPGETVEGAAILVAKVRTALNIRFQGTDPPEILFTDRGQGFYHTNSGSITDQYAAALREHGLRAYYGNDASVQPGSLQEVMLHETSVAWIRRREKVSQLKEPWNETVSQFKGRLQGICQYINAHFEVESLCQAFPKRLQMVIDAEGDRIAP